MLLAPRLSERVETSRSFTNYTTARGHIELGKPSVAIGAYFNVLRVLNLHEDILKVAADDIIGRKLQDMDLYVWLQKKQIGNKWREEIRD